MRTTKGPARNRAKKRMFRRAKGYVGGRNNLLRTVKETLLRAGVYAFRDRRRRKRDFRRLWIIRINAAARQFGMRYSTFMAGLKAAGIELNRKMLSDIAIHDTEGFSDIVAAAKSALAAK